MSWIRIHFFQCESRIRIRIKIKWINMIEKAVWGFYFIELESFEVVFICFKDFSLKFLFPTKLNISPKNLFNPLTLSRLRGVDGVKYTQSRFLKNFLKMIFCLMSHLFLTKWILIINIQEDVSKQFNYITTVVFGNESEQQSDILVAQLSQVRFLRYKKKKFIFFLATKLKEIFFVLSFTIWAIKDWNSFWFSGDV